MDKLVPAWTDPENAASPIYLFYNSIGVKD